MAGYHIQGPDVAAVGWIPYYDKWPDIPKPHLYERQIAMRLLFNSGNPEPRANFGTRNAFEAWVGSSKEYRGALWLCDASLKWSDADPRPILTCARDGVVGYTPPRVVIAGFKLKPPWPLKEYYDGRGRYFEPPPTPDPDWGGVEVTALVTFKLSGSMEKIGRLTTGYWAPSAWMKLTYRMEKAGRVIIRLQGSTIPSQTYYMNWQRQWEHNMVPNTRAQIDGFIQQSESCKMAPAREAPVEEVIQVTPMVEYV